MPEYPRHGQGRRHPACESYSGCLAIAAAENWKNFHCEGCPELAEFDKAKARAEDPLGGGSFLVGQQKERPMLNKKPLCEECNTKPVISPGSRLCASCMAKRSNKDRKKIQKAGRPRGRPKKSGLDSPPQPGVKAYMDRKEAKAKEPIVTVHFDDHMELLAEISRRAEKETRTLELQVIHLLKEQLGTTQKGLV